ncbi:MAG: exodeoxyribonuclease III [Candidatus Dojkabacteria bacterium]|nr:exodeoxyribonuclease III [Candidatus Dojkabacteria bacterium]MDQ7020868.1 exodeoxyribonuclease III [Candidatus Dojkabacteria bacterium]
MKIVSWNVNGIRAALKKGFLEFLENENPDIICIQETKANKEQVEIHLPNYIEFWNSADRKGYSGTAIFTKVAPIEVIKDIHNARTKLEDKFGDANSEGRVITAEFENFYLSTVYTPNAKGKLERLSFRHDNWDPAFLNYIKELDKKKPVVFCGDLNVAHEEIDLARPETNHKNHGFTDEEREGFNNIIEAGFIDSFRKFNNEGGNYTWWSPFAKSRDRNVGWRIDYFCVSNKLNSNLTEAFIRPDQTGSDHCPVGIVLNF